MVILVVFNSFNVVKNLKNPDLVARQNPPSYTTEINDESRGTYNVNTQIKFKISMPKSSLCDYSDAYILVKGTITITGAGDDAAARQADERDKGVVFKSCAPFTN